MLALIIAIAVIVVLIIFFFISAYNQLVALKNRVENAFAQIDVQLKRRYDLIPNLVEIAKKYLSHEQDTLLKVIEARNAAKAALDSAAQSISANAKNSGENPAQNLAQNLAALNQAESSLHNALKGFNITLEAYPELKANTTMIALSEELTSTENKIAFARQAYNDSVMSFNTYKQSFPQNLIAAMFARFSQDLVMLEFDEGRENLNQVPRVQF